jgi:hypothetical protein
MQKQARQTRENRTITIDFQNEATYFQLLGDGRHFSSVFSPFCSPWAFSSGSCWIPGS